MFNPIAPKTMPSNTTISDDGYDEVTDTYAPPTDAQRLTWLERQVQDLNRKLLAHSYPNQRNTGGATDRQIVMGASNEHRMGRDSGTRGTPG